MVLFSSAIYLHLDFLEDGVQKVGGHFLWILGVGHRAVGEGADKLHVNACSFEQAVVLGNHSGKAEHGDANLTDYLFHSTCLIGEPIKLCGQFSTAKMRTPLLIRFA